MNVRMFYALIKAGMPTRRGEFMESMIAIMKSRHSVRSYRPDSIEAQKLATLETELAKNQIGPLGSRVRFALIDASDYPAAELKKFGTYGFIKGPRVYIAGAVNPGGSSMEDYGYLMERNILFATELGLGTCWLGGSLNRGTFSEQLKTTAEEVIPAVTPVGYEAEKRTMIDRMIRVSAGAANRKKTEEIFFAKTAGTPLDLDSIGDYATALDAVRGAPSASNKQPWRIIKGEKNLYHFCLKEDAAYNNAFKGIKIQNLDIGIAMCHFELAANELGLGGKWTIEKPDIAAGDLQYIVSWDGD